VNVPLSWLSPSVFAYRGRPWWHYAGVALITLAPTAVWLATLVLVGGRLGLAWWVLLALYVLAGEISWVTHTHPRPGLLQHAASFGFWVGWPPYYEFRVWRLHLYLGWEPTAQPGRLDLSVRLMLHRQEDR
jgi:hypothetical protein